MGIGDPLPLPPTPPRTMNGAAVAADIDVKNRFRLLVTMSLVVIAVLPAMTSSPRQQRGTWKVRHCTTRWRTSYR